MKSHFWRGYFICTLKTVNFCNCKQTTFILICSFHSIFIFLNFLFIPFVFVLLLFPIDWIQKHWHYRTYAWNFLGFWFIFIFLLLFLYTFFFLFLPFYLLFSWYICLLLFCYLKYKQLLPGLLFFLSNLILVFIILYLFLWLIWIKLLV